MPMNLNAIVFEEDGWFVAQCLELDIASQGNTAEEAFGNLQEAVELHLQEPLHCGLQAFAGRNHAACRATAAQSVGHLSVQNRSWQAGARRPGAGS